MRRRSRKVPVQPVVTMLMQGGSEMIPPLNVAPLRWAFFNVAPLRFATANGVRKYSLCTLTQP